MNENDTGSESEFERRTRIALQESVSSVDAATRSKLTQARHAALEAATPRRAWLAPRALVPAGAFAVAVLASVIVLDQRGESPLQNAEGGAVADMELLADADAFDLSDEDDYEFIEWVAAMNESGPAGT
jgi:hypothetical protein